MAIKIRLRQQGRKNYRTYRLVVMDSRQGRDGKYLENLGWYNPKGDCEELEVSVKADRVKHWLAKGAQLSQKAEALVSRAAPAALCCGCSCSSKGE